MMRRWTIVALLLCAVAGAVWAIPPAFFRGGFRYLFLDRFTTAASAPLSSPRTCEPGPGALTITDTENKLSIASGALTFAGGKVTPAPGDPGVWSSTLFTRTSGLAMLFTMNGLSGAEALRVGWDFDQAGYGVDTIRTAASTDTQIYAIYDNNTQIGGVFSISYPAQFAIIQRSTGTWYCWKGASDTQWKLRWVGHLATGNRYASIANLNASFTIDNLRVVHLPTWGSDAMVYTAYTASPGNPASQTMISDALVGVTWTPQAGEVFELDVRRTDADNRWIHRCDQAGSTMKIIERNAGVETERASAAQTWTAGTAYRVVSITDTAEIRQFVGNSILNTYSSATFNQTATGVTVSGHTSAANLYSWPRYINIPGGV